MTDRNNRTRRGTFAPGNKGGPGREAGRREHRAAIYQACSPEDVGKVIRKLVEQALEGDVGAAALLLNRVLGKPREEAPPVQVDLGDLTTIEQVKDAVHQVVRLVADGRMGADDGKRLVDLLSSAVEVSEISAILEQHDPNDRPDPWRRN